MDNKKDERVTFENYKDQVDIWYKSHNIIREKAELYYDFLFSLLNVIEATYLGPDIIVSDEDIRSHFDWCFNKVISNFEQERIYFLTKNDQYQYLWFFFYKAYYKCSTENKYQILLDYFKLLFNFNKVKTPVELESFTDLYKIFDQNLKKNK